MKDFRAVVPMHSGWQAFHLVASDPINSRFSVTLLEGNRAAVAPLVQFTKQDL
jgi:hypothetical protein